MALFWGITPHQIDQLDDPQRLIDEVIAWGKQQDVLKPGDHVVFVTGTGVIENAHNFLVVHEVKA